jgi:squalene-hopene/tetraprenyl-beta-curcumene cyclase
MFTEDHPSLITLNRSLASAIHRAQKKLLALQHQEGYWIFELEADCTIPAEYIMLMHYLDDIDARLQEKIATYLRGHQSDDGSYPLFYGGIGDISCSVKVYYALKMAGDDINAVHMKSLRSYIISQGGAAKANVFTRIALAIFEQVPWRAAPFIPVEIMLLPKWFPFHIDKVSYWSRTVMVPLFILCTLEAKAKNPLNVDILELFITPPDKEQHYFPDRGLLNKSFLFLDYIGRKSRCFVTKKMHKRAIKKASDWFTERLNGENGLGAIFPAMVNVYQAMLLLGLPKDHPHVITARKAIDNLLVIKEHEAYCQPCLSPVWDTGLSLLALQETDLIGTTNNRKKAYHWLKSKQLSNEAGDWRIPRPKLEGGGWAFQYTNPHYPDVDDTAVIAFAMATSGLEGMNEPIHRATRWIIGMQDKNGGYGAFDVDNTNYYLNEIPFADHGALLDPPTADVSARCVMLIAKVAQNHKEYLPAFDRCITYLRKEQEENGSWFGRWGSNYIYGTWSVLIALEQTNIVKSDPLYTKAITWLKSIQHSDGGWGEDNQSYFDDSLSGKFHSSTVCQSSWAILALIAAGEVNSEVVKKGINYLLNQQNSEGLWTDSHHNAPGFPRVFYLKYHGYDKFFPLWALAKYRNQTSQP